MLNTTELVQVDTTGRRLALAGAGVGAPTVVLETGLGAESEEWETVLTCCAKACLLIAM